jgi:acetyl esterase/lipase
MTELHRVQDWGRMSRAEREAEYSNSGAVANSAALVEAMVAASAARRREASSGLDQPYGPRERNKVDLFPGADPAAPCLVFLHGGYWQRNGRESFTVLMDGVRAHGWTAALPGYTLTPEATLTEIVAEVHAALDWLTDKVQGPVILSGWSAGGHLTAMALHHPRVYAGLAISGVFELGPLRDTSLNDALRLTDEEVAFLSPLRLPPGPKPLAIAYGTAELPPFIHDARGLNWHRAADHAPGALIPVAGANHFTVVDSLRQPEGVLTRAALALV